MRKRFECRTIGLFCILMAGIIGIMGSVYRIIGDEGILAAAAQQGTYRCTIASFRGTIYDTNLQALTGLGELTKLSSPLDSEDIFWVNERYQEDQDAVHVIGYLDGDGNGVDGIEKAYNGYLADGGQLSAVYQVDALNQAIAGMERTIDDTSELQNKGVVLTLDKEIQEIAQEAAEKYLTKGSVLVTEIPSCEIRASVSLPTYSPYDVADTLDEKGAPLLNRAFSSYPVGSVFKLVVAAAALEKGVSTSLVYDCPGSISVDGMEFKCFNGVGHGKVDLEKAIAYSCNGYFIQADRANEAGGAAFHGGKAWFRLLCRAGAGHVLQRGKPARQKRTCPTPRLRRTFPLARGTCWLRRCKLPRWSIPSPAAGCIPNRLW